MVFRHGNLDGLAIRCGLRGNEEKLRPTVQVFDRYRTSEIVGAIVLELCILALTN